MKKFFTLAAAMVAALSISAQEFGEACYVIGEVNGNSWSPSVGVEMNKVGDGVFRAVVDVQGYFGVTWGLSEAGVWDEINAMRLYPADGNQMVTLENDKAVIELSTDKNGGDAWTLGAAATATLTVDYNEMTLTIEAGNVVVDDRVFLVGDITGWSFDNEDYVMAQNGAIYTLNNVTIAGGFKLANKAWAPVNVGAAYDEEGVATWPVLNEPYAALNDGGSGNMLINNDAENAYTVNVKLDLTDANAPIVTVTEATGIENIAADNAPAVYYNLQGVQVANPANGLYIVKQGNNVSKVLVK